jgi:hypothetical protein
MKPLHLIVVAVGVLALLASVVSSADSRRDAIVAQLLAQAKKEPGLTHKGGKPNTPSCTSCHGSSPQEAGKTRAGVKLVRAVSQFPGGEAFRRAGRASFDGPETSNASHAPLGLALTTVEA